MAWKSSSHCLAPAHIYRASHFNLDSATRKPSLMAKLLGVPATIACKQITRKPSGVKQSLCSDSTGQVFRQDTVEMSCLSSMMPAASLEPLLKRLEGQGWWESFGCIFTHMSVG